jgi:hypothetical protein
VPHCSQYWEIEESNSAVFKKIQEARAATDEERDGESSKGLEDEYLSVLMQLDQHAATCPICRKK